MKTRSDFVTNSSSSSFIIAKKYLDPEQILAIRHHIELAQKMGENASHWMMWDIEENDQFISGYTSQDNFDMDWFLSQIGVPLSHVKWGESSFCVWDDYDYDNDSKHSYWRDALYNLMEEKV